MSQIDTMTDTDLIDLLAENAGLRSSLAASEALIADLRTVAAAQEREATESREALFDALIGELGAVWGQPGCREPWRSIWWGAYTSGVALVERVFGVPEGERFKSHYPPLTEAVGHARKRLELAEERAAGLESQCAALRAALERIGTRCWVVYPNHPEDTTCLSRQRDARINPEDYGLPLRDRLILGKDLCIGCIAASALQGGAGERE